VLEGLEEFMAQHTPKQIFECEKLRWKFMTPFLEPTLSRHLTVQKMGMFAIASLAYQAEVTGMTAENFIGPLQCLRWAKNRELKNLAKAAVKAIYAKLGVRAETIASSVPLVPRLERICIHTIQHDTNLCGLRERLQSLPEVVKQSLNLDTLLVTSRAERKTFLRKE